MLSYYDTFIIIEVCILLLHSLLGMIIYANSVDITSQFYANTDSETPSIHIREEPSSGTLIISKMDETLSVLLPTSGKSLDFYIND
jgi:hypothetical protein